ncbi:MAG: M20/M25/M40 family metallo-hydrolase [Firmicutes bacterium]|nr:M20/M25/M40 family metallo-hydrolase [Bacillota bacterium]
MLLILGTLLGGLPVPLHGQPPAAQPVAAATARVDLDKLSEEALEWLAGLIRIDTTNPPGNELAAARYLAEILRREGLRAEVFESAPGRGIVIARLQAGAIPDPSRALLLVGHTDVVGVEPEHWSTNPFGGEIRNGYLWGRGALDDKAMVIANLAVLVALKRAGTPLHRDVIFLATGDEETSGEHGIEFAIRQHWEKIAAAFVLNEGGWVLVKNGQVHHIGVQTSEKVPVNVEVIASGTAGHSSVPQNDNAIVRLARALTKIAGYEPPAKLLAVTRRYFEGLAAIENGENSRWMRALEEPGRTELAAARLAAANPVWNAMLRNTVSVTLVQAGVRSNVIPAEARATLNIRLLPGESVDALIEELRKRVDEPGIRFEVALPSRYPAPPSSIDSELFETIQRVSQQFFPEAAVLPMLSPGATDSAQLRLRNVQAYGLLPFPLTEEDLARIHGANERIPLDAFRTGLRYLHRVVTEFVSATKP